MKKEEAIAQKKYTLKKCTSQRFNQSFVKSLQSKRIERNCFKNLRTLKKKTLAHKLTEKKKLKMTMTRKFNIDNGLQGQTKEHQTVVTRIGKWFFVTFGESSST